MRSLPDSGRIFNGAQMVLIDCGGIARRLGVIAGCALAWRRITHCGSFRIAADGLWAADNALYGCFSFFAARSPATFASASHI